MGKILYLFKYLKARLKEPSTAVALAVVLDKFGVDFASLAINEWIAVLTIVFASIGVFVAEGKPETEFDDD